MSNLQNVVFSVIKSEKDAVTKLPKFKTSSEASDILGTYSVLDDRTAMLKGVDTEKSSLYRLTYDVRDCAVLRTGVRIEFSQMYMAGEWKTLTSTEKLEHRYKVSVVDEYTHPFIRVAELAKTSERE